MSRLGPYNRNITLAKLDGRTKEAALMRRVREELTAFVGRPDPVQRQLIEGAAVLSLRCAQIDAKILVGEELTLHDNNYSVAWNNCLRRTLTALGVKPSKPGRRGPPVSLDHLFVGDAA